MRAGSVLWIESPRDSRKPRKRSRSRRAKAYRPPDSVIRPSSRRSKDFPSAQCYRTHASIASRIRRPVSVRFVPWPSAS